MQADVILVGAGLANGLIALALAAARPDLRILMLDRAAGPTTAQTWSFHGPDLSPLWHARLDAGIRHRWQGQEVRFATYIRRLDTGYATLDGAGLIHLLSRHANICVQWQTTATQVMAGAVRTTGGQYTAPCVIDGRGALPSPALVTGFQKFLGIEYEMAAPHGIATPVIMDATVPQHDGYRFVYLLPFSPTRLLVEDTRYSDGAALDPSQIAQDIAGYIADHGWRGVELRREQGVLPITLAQDAPAFWDGAKGSAVPVGLRAGLFHPVTGYSLPVAAQVADVVAKSPLTTPAVFDAVRDYALRRARDDRFLRLLNRMLFRGCAPARRHHVMARFYGLNTPLIERFYAGTLTRRDKLRLVTGKPPIPIRAALPCLREAPLLKDT